MTAFAPAVTHGVMAREPAAPFPAMEAGDVAASVMLRTATAEAMMTVSAASTAMRGMMAATERLATVPTPMGGMGTAVGAVAPAAVTAMAEVVGRTATAVTSTARGVMMPATAMRAAEAVPAAMGVSVLAAVPASSVIPEAVAPSAMRGAAATASVSWMTKAVTPTVRGTAMGGTAPAMTAEARTTRSVSGTARRRAARVGTPITTARRSALAGWFPFA